MPHMPLSPVVNVLMRLFFCLSLVYCGCLRNPVAPPVNVLVHITKTGGGRLSADFADTIVKAGSKMTVKAFPDSAMLFLGWFGSLSSTQDSVTFVVTENMNIEARFRPFPHEPGLIEIISKNKTFIMGSSEAGARQEEKPAHSVRFRYSFFMDKYEVTQRQFEVLMGTNPSQARPFNGVSALGDSFPVYSVTWYEAALFCNARSKAAGLDTVYDFTAICNENQVCPYVLENLRIHFDRFGYRLPTEAEWEYACRAGSTADYFWGAQYPDTTNLGGYCWYNENSKTDETSEYNIHPVGKTKPNAFGLYDMTGNVAEWVNDWLGFYPDTVSVDPVGPVFDVSKISEDSLELPVRGGSFNQGKEYLRSWVRKGEYPTPAKLNDWNIGFRCALGAFFPPTPSGSNVKTDTSGVQSCNLSELVGFLGTSSVKCVFVKETSGGRKLYFIDFTATGKPLFELSDSQPPHCPVISPDGGFVAYSSKGPNGFSGASTVTVRSLRASNTGVRSSPAVPAFVPRWWVDQNNLDTFIVFPNNTVNDNDSIQWKTSKTYRQKISGGMFIGQPQLICDTGSFNGGLSYDGVFLATGFKKAHVLNLRANDLYDYFDAFKNGTPYPIQVCNVSINPGYENQDEIMFLDFGIKSVSSIVGRSYGIHEVIFTTSSVDSTRWYDINEINKEKYDNWDDVEWSNNPQYAIAIAKSNTNAENNSIFCIDLKNHAYLKIAEGNNIQEPSFWVDPTWLPPKQDPYYNFAKYNIPGKVSAGQMPLCMKLKLFWSQFNDLQCVAVGGSPLYFGLNPEYISVKTLNMGTVASDPMTSYTVALNYACSHVSNLKVVIMGLDAYALNFNSDNPYLNGLPRTLGYGFDLENDFWKTGLPDKIKSKIALFDSTQWLNFSSNGYLKAKPLGQGSWGDTIFQGAAQYEFEDSTIQKNILIFKTFASLLAARKTHFILVNFPENPKYKQTSMIGCIGPSKTTYAKLAAWLRNLEKQNTYFHFYDANMNGDHDYTDAEALDCNHLNYLGAKKLSTRVDSLCSVYLK
jgi:formylglycine-generating enzyme required for sulfatase activity